MNKNVFIRVNGRGSAWPVFIGNNHPFYSMNDPDDLGNASFSIFGSPADEFSFEKIEWSILIDAGHNIPSYIIRNENRIPDTIILTHPHIDHTLGLDWIIESYNYKHHKQKKYPLYATSPCWEIVRKTYYPLNNIVEFKELVPGEPVDISEVPGARVTALPVYHGEKGLGASMLVFEFSGEDDISETAAFSGDMLCPLFRRIDYHVLSLAKVLYVDCNNRFPYPLSTHGSLTAKDPVTGSMNQSLIDFIEHITFPELMAPHLQHPHNPHIQKHLNEVLKENPNPGELPFSVIDLLRRAPVPLVNLVHYGGREDELFNGQSMLTDIELETWANSEAEKEMIESEFVVPKAGNLFKLI